jgi:hypothetical protein
MLLSFSVDGNAIPFSESASEDLNSKTEQPDAY